MKAPILSTSADLGRPPWPGFAPKSKRRLGPENIGLILISLCGWNVASRASPPQELNRRATPLPAPALGLG